MVFIRCSMPAKLSTSLFFWFVVCCCLVALPQSGFCNPKGLLKSGLTGKTVMGSRNARWNISAAEISYNQKTDTYTARGNVRMYSGDRTIQADWAQLNARTHEVHLKGHVKLTYGKDWIEGREAVWNVQQQTGTVDDGLVYFSSNHFYVKGRLISKTGATEYLLKNGSLTSCDPENPAWQIRYHKMRVHINGEAWATQTSFWVRNVPVFYFPLVGVPIQRERHSGFLMPWGGSSTRTGPQVEIPYYWAIARDMDATLYGRYMGKRGFMGGLQYRLNNKTWGEGIFAINYLHDEGNTQELANAGYPLVTRNRYWLRGRYNFQLPYQITGRMNLDAVSDPNFLREFTTGSISYYLNNEEFLQRFGRGILDDNTISARENSLYLTRATDSTLTSLDLHYWDQSNPAINQFAPQRLPEFDFDVAPSWIGHLPFYYSLQSSWTNYWEQDGDKTSRLDLYPSLNYPLHWGNYLDFQPSVALRSTTYYVNWQDEVRDQWQERLLPEVQMDLVSRLNHVYSFHVWGDNALQHSIRPEITYIYTPEVNPKNYPQFDQVDDLQGQHGIRYGFTNIFTAKRVSKNAAGKSVTNYSELARVEIYQTFNIRPAPASAQFGVPPVELNTTTQANTEKRRLSDVSLLVDLNPGRYVNLSYKTDISPYNASAERQEVYAILNSGRGQTLSLSYQYWQGTVVNELIAETNLKILPNLSLITYHDYSLQSHELYRQVYGVNYMHGCWGIGVDYEKVGNDQRFMVVVRLAGLGSVGSSFGLGATGGP